MFCYSVAMKPIPHHPAFRPELPDRDHRLPRHIGRRITAGVAIATLLGGAVYGVDKALQGGPSSEAKAVAGWEKGSAPIFNATLVLNEGVHIRSTFKVKHQDKDFGTSSNTVETVGKGKVVIVDFPISYTDKNGDTWYGFMSADKSPKRTGSPSKIAGELNWVNATEIADQSQADGRDLNPYLQIYSHEDKGAVDQNGIFTANFDNGIVMAAGNTPVAVSQNMSADYAATALSARGFYK